MRAWMRTIRRAATPCGSIAAIAAACLLATVPAQTLGQSGAPAAPPAGSNATAPAFAPDWIQLGTRGVDTAVAEDGQRWMVGSDGRAYRWNEAAARWAAFGSRNDLARIDATRAGVAALTRSGELVVSDARNDGTSEWRSTGMRASDVGLGGGRIWLADAQAPDRSRAVMHAAFDPATLAANTAAANAAWTLVPGRIERIAVDNAGRPWALDAQGFLFVFANNQWIADATAPAAADVAVSANGTVLLVNRQRDAARGGGTLHARDPQSGVWTVLPGRLTAISAEPDGRPFGVNSLSWVIGATRGAGPAAAISASSQKPEPQRAPDEVRLAELAPTGVSLPEGLNDVTVKVRSGNAKQPNAVLLGEASLNGVATRVIRYAPLANGPVNLLLVHRSLRLGDYLPDLANTAARGFPFADVIVSFVPAANADRKPRAADAAFLGREPGLADAANFAPSAGTTLTGTVDLATVPAGSAVSTLMGLGTSKVTLVARNVDAALFKEVRDGQAPAAPAMPARTLEDLRNKYGAKLIDGLAFEAPIKSLDGKPFGPARLSGPVWTFALAQEDDAVALAIGIAATMGVTVQAPAPGSVALAAAGQNTNPNAIKSAPETLELSNVRVLFDLPKRSASLNGNVTRAASAKVASLKGFELEPARITGSLALADGQRSFTGLNSLKTLDLALNSLGRLPSQATTSGAKVELEVKLALNDERNAVVPAVTATGNLTLADIVGAAVPGAAQVKLTRVEWTPGTIAGNASLYGLPVRAVRHQGKGMAAPIIGLHHRELDLGSYIPAIRGTNIGSFGLANAVLYVLPEKAQPVTYAKAEDMPAPLAALLDRKDLEDIDPYPLTLKPGVNVIGLWGAKGEKETDGGVAAKVKSIYGLEDKAFIAKGHFKAGALGNARLESGRDAAGTPGTGPQGGAQRGAPGGNNAQGGTSDNASQTGSQGGSSQGGSASTSTSSSGSSGSRGNRTVSPSQVACAADTTLNVASRASGGALDTGGLDLAIQLPGFNPPYAAGRIRFSNASFAIREVDGQLEPAITGSMAFNLARIAGDLNGLARHAGAPAAVQTAATLATGQSAGVNQLGLAAKLRVKGDLNTLCNGVKPDSSYEVEFAGATALNLADVGAASFDALEKVTNLNPPKPLATSATPATTPADPLAARMLERARKIADSMRRAAPPPKGWKPAFGLPFLEIRKFAAAGTFGQKEGKRTLTGSLWTESTLGKESIDVLGSMTLEADASADEYKVADWLLRLPGPVKFTGLPGMEKLARATPALDLGDLTLANLELTPKLMQGDLRSAARNITGSAVILAEPVEGGEPDVQVFAGVNRFAPNMVLKPGARLPATPGDLTLGRTLFALRSGGSTQPRLADLPASVGKLFADTVGDLVTEETTLRLTRGISIAGRLNPAEIPDRPAFANLRGFFDTLEMNQPMPVFGGIDLGAGPAAGSTFMEAWLPRMRVPGLPQASLSISNARLSFANLEGRALRTEADLLFVPPPSMSAATGSEMAMRGLIDYTRNEAGDTRVVLSGQTGASVTPTFGLTGLRFSNLGLEVEATRQGTGSVRKRSKTLSLIADADFRGLAARARFGATNDGSGTSGALLELTAREQGQLLDLDTLVRALPLLPAAYKHLNIADYLSLKSRGILIATEAGTGRVSLAAEDAEGQVNGQTFKGQVAIAGLTSSSPSLFIANDQPWTPARVFPAAIPKGPFADLPLPEGLVILAPSRADANVSALHPRIYDKVFARLYGARDAAKVFTNEGLTVVGKLNLSRNLPELMKVALGPVLGFLPVKGDLIAGGGIDGSSGGLAFYVDLKGLKLPIPSPVNTFVKSTDGDVQVFFKTAGASGAGTEAGVAADVQFGLPRLDTPTTLQTVKARMSLGYVASPGAAPALAVALDVPGRWDNPAGLDGFSLTDSKVAVGTSANGNTVSVATQRAQFKDKAFALDLNTAWVGGAPTQLSVQLAKSPDTAELMVSSALQAEIAASVLQLAFKGGSALQRSIMSRLPAQPGFDPAARAAMSSVATLIGKTAGGMTTLAKASPLGMVGVRNPEVFFATPGNDLPDRPGVERPPFGLGLLVRGQLILDIGTVSANIANGEYRINLRDGYYVRGSVTPPAPFASSTLSLSGGQYLGTAVPSGLVLNGKLELPGMKFLGSIDANLSGNFVFKQPAFPNVGADVAARVRIGSLASRAAYFTARPNSLRVYSAPDGGCTDVPLKLDGTFSSSTLSNPASLLTMASLDPPNPVKCAVQLGQLAAEVGKDIGRAGEAAGRAVGGAAVAAANGAANAANAAFNGARQAVAAIGAAFGGGGTKVCNQRWGWLNERGNRPTRAASQAMLDNIYVPLTQRIAEARNLANTAAGYGTSWANGNSALGAVIEEWNRGAGANAMPGLAFYHPAGGINTNPNPTARMALQLELQGIAANLQSGNRDFNALAPWPTQWADWDNGRRSEAQALWWRCANAWTADIPIRTAQAWRLPIPLHKGKFPDAMFMSHGNYEDLKRRLIRHIGSKASQIAGASAQLNERGRAWATRNKRLHQDLMDKIQQSTGVANVEAAVKRISDALDKDPGNARLDAQFEAARKAADEYGEAVLALHNLVYNVIELGPAPNRQQVTAAVKRVRDAVAGVRAALRR